MPNSSADQSVRILFCTLIWIYLWLCVLFKLDWWCCLLFHFLEISSQFHSISACIHFGKCLLDIFSPNLKPDHFRNSVNISLGMLRLTTTLLQGGKLLQRPLYSGIINTVGTISHNGLLVLRWVKIMITRTIAPKRDIWRPEERTRYSRWFWDVELLVAVLPQSTSLR